MQALWRRGQGRTEVGKGDDRAWRWEEPSTGQARAPGGEEVLQGEQQGWRRWGGMPGPLAGRSPWGASRGSGGRWWRPSRWRGGPTLEAIARAPANVHRVNLDVAGGGGGDNVVHRFNLDECWFLLMAVWSWMQWLWSFGQWNQVWKSFCDDLYDNKEVIVDDNPDMRNAFLPKSLKITARLLEIFCSCWELLGNWL